MQHEPLELSLVDAPQLSTARDVFLAASRFAAPASAPIVKAPAGPGWFDSSFDLERGLEVKEGWPGDAALHQWLDGYLLAPQRSERAAVRRTSSRTAAPRSMTAMA